ncbi:unnamed protein product [Peniophora sp. CBMAI 1063]|nr:unnamed protein product [Peniophora sp. CBMAI 1063]
MSLSDEIYQAIFRFAVDSWVRDAVIGCTGEPGKHSNRYHQATSLSHVNARWRGLVLDTADLWSTLVTGHFNSKMIYVALQRSKDLKLEVYILPCSSVARFLALITMALLDDTQSGRISRLIIRLDERTAMDTPLMFDKVFPSLTELSVCHDKAYIPRAIPLHGTFAKHFPNLHILSLTKLPVTPDLMSGLSLSELRLEDCMIRERVDFSPTGSASCVIDILARIPGLEVFTWLMDRDGRHAHPRPTTWDGDSPRVVRLARLRKLELRAPMNTICYMMISVDVPRDCDFELEAALHWQTTDIASLKEKLRNTVGRQLLRTEPADRGFTHLSLHDANFGSGVLMHWSSPHSQSHDWSRDFRFTVTATPQPSTDVPPRALADVCTSIMGWQPLSASLNCMTVTLPWFYTYHADYADEIHHLWQTAVSRLPSLSDVRTLHQMDRLQEFLNDTAVPGESLHINSGEGVPGGDPCCCHHLLMPPASM